jgi:hypothetical protein
MNIETRFPSGTVWFRVTPIQNPLLVKKVNCKASDDTTESDTSNSGT